MKIRKDDNVIVISGKDKGKTGKVVKVLPLSETVVVAGINMKKVHRKPTKKGQKGQVIEQAAPIAISSVMMIDPKSSKPTRVGFIFEAGKKKRIALKSKTVL